ncbi:hypothetical protein RHSIM_Rhsim04G0009000 [Rhododendron simsii]|uniref:Amino acid transporter transmembrane domain-containing protein n=1 Tax=Rhododendron simsii TaxID=118357 RepID=A0A834LSA8_RHOSS|nr:hypothetical protein RHSIM_Rhsim04G0009000 [Rhododendron simsii]
MINIPHQRCTSVIMHDGVIKGSIVRIATSTAAQKMILWSRLRLKTREAMKKASTSAIFITTFFYLCCGCFGYAAFGSETPGNLLSGFGFYEPYWLVDFANACIVLNLVGGYIYQVYSQPVFATVEGWISGKFPNSGFLSNFYSFKLPLIPALQLNPLRDWLCFRTGYVVSTTVIAMSFP